jgi:3-isopropylmalate/(R)-2-methylmalate dehydratase small subunit
MKGTCWKYGADINTDLIIAGRYLSTTDPKLLAGHCMEDLDPHFAAGVRPGDIILADKNFGCGSSREHAPLALKAAGITCVVAKSFARIFYRNAFNLGLPVIVCPEAYENSAAGDVLEISLQKGTISNLTRGTTFSAEPIPEFMRQIISRGGLMEYVASTREKG